VYQADAGVLFSGEIKSTRGDPNPKDTHMDITFAAGRLAHHQAAALDRDVELRRRILDRGTTIAPARPEVSLLTSVGVWFRTHRAASHARVSY
jgi:hypothetical protein